MRILISGYYGFDNVGDEAILAASVPILRERWPAATICVLSASPSRTAKAYGVEAVDRWSLLTIWEELRRSDLLISGGGGLLQDTTSLVSSFYYLGVMRLAQAARRPYFFFAQGVGPLRGATVRRLAAARLRHAAGVTVRDEASAALLAQLGVRRPLSVTADPALLLQPCPRERVSAILAEHDVDPDEPLAGVALRAWPGVEAVADAVIPLLRSLHDDLGCRVVLIPFQAPGDVDVAWRVGAESKTPTVVLDGLVGPAEYAGVITRLRCLVTMRLHGLIFAASNAVPALGLAYDPKLTAFAAQANQPCMGLRGLTADALVSRLNTFLAGAEIEAPRRLDTAKRLRAEAMLNFDALDKVLAQLTDGR